MNTFLLNISSPDGKLYSGDVTGLVIRGVAGELMVLAGHIPFITNVKPGTRCALYMADGSTKEGMTDGGLLTVGKDEVTYLTAGIDWD